MYQTILLALFIAFVGAQTDSDDFPIPSFPSSFVGIFERWESYFTENNQISTYYVSHNAEDKKTAVKVSKKGHQDENYWLIYNPSGSHRTKGYLEFKELHRKRKGYWVDYCSYTSHVDISGYPVSPPSIFPSHWRKDHHDFEIGNWFSFPDDVQYNGEQTYQGEKVRVWSSNSECALFDHPPIPCKLLMVKEDNPNIPFVVQDAYEKRNGSFESDWIQIDTWTEFLPQEPSISLPWDNWRTTCYNEENGININPSRAFVTTPSGRDSFKVSLKSYPIEELGDVTVKIHVTSGSPDCATFETRDGDEISELTFNTDNWNEEQTIYFKYAKEGEISFQLTATGGGYNIPHLTGQATTSLSVRGICCSDGTPGYGCNKK